MTDSQLLSKSFEKKKSQKFLATKAVTDVKVEVGEALHFYATA